MNQPARTDPPRHARFHLPNIKTGDALRLGIEKSV